MKTTKLWMMLWATMLCTGFVACGDDNDDDVSGVIDAPEQYYSAPTRNELTNRGPWKLEERKDVSDDEGFPIGTQYDCHEMAFNYDGTGWERRHGYLETYKGPENNYDTGQQEFVFKYKATENPKSKEEAYGTLVITSSDGASRTIKVTTSYGNGHYQICFDSIAYEGNEYPHSDPVDPVNPDTTNNNPSNHPDTLTTIDGYEFVDLGLSVKWAASNLRGYYQYGNTSADDFKTEYELTKYGIGGTSEDPAYANMSNKWRLPTRGEAQELVASCTWVYTAYGFEVTGPNGNSILLPLDGAYPLGNESNLLYYGYQCWLMTSTLDGGGNPRPYILKASYINSYNQPTVTVTTSEAYRISGMSVRGVSEADPDVTYNK